MQVSGAHFVAPRQQSLRVVHPYPNTEVQGLCGPWPAMRGSRHLLASGLGPHNRAQRPERHVNALWHHRVRSEALPHFHLYPHRAIRFPPHSLAPRARISKRDFVVFWFSPRHRRTRFITASMLWIRLPLQQPSDITRPTLQVPPMSKANGKNHIARVKPVLGNGNTVACRSVYRQHNYSRARY